MADIPLTEKRFLELLQLNNETINKRLDIIDIKLNNLQKYQNNESYAIEYELRQLLLTYLKSKYSRYLIKEFPIKTPTDPYSNKTMTDFDAAYIVTPYEHTSNINRLTEKIKLNNNLLEKYPSTQKFSNSITFVLAEAKHHISHDQIKTKLSQFKKINIMFSLAKQIITGQLSISQSQSLLGLTDKFVKTVYKFPFLSQIDDSILFFGAPYWEGNLLTSFQNDIKMFKTTLTKYNSIASNIDKIKESDKKPEIIKDIINKKVKLHTILCNIANKWYDINDIPEWCSVIDSTSILNHTIEDDSLLRIHVIKPSGGRYHVDEDTEISGVSSIALTGGNKTRRIKKI